MNDDLSYEENARIVRERKEKQQKLLREKSHRDLQSKIEISINTTMIGALEEMENAFNHVMGQPGVNKSEAREDFEEARSNILDRGNQALKKAKFHLSRFEVTEKQDKKFNFQTRIKNRNE